MKQRRKTWKQVLTVAITVALVFTMLPVNAVKAAKEYSGTCGDNLTWTLSNNRLTISGTGPMYDYSEENPAPWKGKNVYFCTVNKGVTSIGEYAFLGGNEGDLKIDISATVTQIGHKAFANRRCIIYYFGGAMEIAEDACLNGSGTAFYVTGWEEADCQGYGGKYTWRQCQVDMLPDTKALYLCNEPIRPEDFVFQASTDGANSILYPPQSIEIGEYDNSTRGEKTVTVIADGYEFTHTYVVTDGQSHMELVEVEIPACYYTGMEIKPEPVVKVGSITLIKNKDYTVSYQNNIAVGSNARVVITGMNQWESLSASEPFYILKRNLSDGTAGVIGQSFTGMPVMPKISVYAGGGALKEGQDYVAGFGKNVNMGTASYYVAGMGNYYGYKTGSFEINNYNNVVRMPGAYNGNISGELTEDVEIMQVIIAPGTFTAEVDDLQHRHYAYYELYEVIGEDDISLITTKETDYGYHNYTAFTYDFSDIYENAQSEGGAVYMLAYTWVNSLGNLYSGVCLLYIPAKVADATEMVVERLEGTEDFRRVYFAGYGLDGHVDTVAWSTSNGSIATVEDGVVTFRKPGTVTVTGQYGSLQNSQTVTMEGYSLSQCDFFDYDPETGEVSVCYRYMLLEEGTDYTVQVSTRENVTTVTLTGCGLFSGQLVRQYSADQKPMGHAHSFTVGCDSTCDSCGFTRDVDHSFLEEWKKDLVQHWHVCTLCGEKKDIDNHSFLPDNEDVCTVCGTLWIPGDVNGDYIVDNQDVEYLLWYTLFPESYPLLQSADYNGDGIVNNQDVEYLLWHTLFPEEYPLL